VLIEDLAQVVLDRQRDLAGDQPPADREPEPQDAGAEQRQDEGQDAVAMLGFDRVHSPADQQRDQHRHPHRQPREQQRPDQRTPIWTQKAE
jgi:hypothetical protein